MYFKHKDLLEQSALSVNCGDTAQIWQHIKDLIYSRVYKKNKQSYMINYKQDVFVGPVYTFATLSPQLDGVRQRL